MDEIIATWYIGPLPFGGKKVEPQNQENVQPNHSLYNWRHFEGELEKWSPT